MDTSRGADSVTGSAGATGRRDEPVAIVGLSCRLPGAAGPDAFWRLLRDGRDVVTEVPAGRPSAGGRWGAFLDDVDHFDAAFFGVSPREAAVMDPQQRLMLELAWAALEDARTVPGTLRDSATGVFVGAMRDDYAALLGRAGAAAAGHHAMTGVSRGLIANRVSHFLGLRGPSLVVDAGQASSLVAVHSAVLSLQRGESRVALAGGVNLNLAADTAAVAEEFGGLSPDGRCRTFDARANGFVRGEGGVALLLKPLSDAVAAGDRVYAVIRGGAVNNDGATEGLTVPSRDAQAAVLRQAYAAAGLPPAAAQYVELHGTGTPVGDPVEAAALGEVLGDARDAGRPLLVGSVKTNLGHLESAAGVTGLLKVLLAMRHGRIPASLHFERAHPDVPLDALHLRVADRAADWPEADRPRVAGVSAFGMGGTNCHLVLSEAPETVPDAPPDAKPPAEPDAVPWVLSARSAAALRGQASALRPLAESGADAVDVGWSLATTRTAFEYRAVVTGGHAPGAAALAAGEPAAGVVSGATGPVRRTAFVFPGQGAQWAGMGRALLASSPAFAQRVADCEQAMSGLVDWSVTEVLRGDDGAPSLDRVDVVQPASFVMMVSLAELWRSYGVEPSAVVGHSQGEIAAACVAGVLTLEDAAKVVCLRSRAIAELAGDGAMASLALPAGEAGELLEPWAGRASVAVVNSPAGVVVSGEPEAVEQIVDECARREIRARLLPVDYASHSPAMDVLRDRLAVELSGVVPRPGDIPLMSAVTGDWADPRTMDAGYWFTNLRERVRFADAVRRLARDGFGVFVESSSHPVLAAAVEATLEASGDEPDVVAGSLGRDDGGLDRFTAGLAELWVRGVPVDWAAAFAGARPRVVDLPTYAFQRRRHWFDTVAPETDDEAANAVLVRLAEADADERPRLLLDLVRAHAAAVLGHGEADAIAPRTSFRDAGFDSQSSVRLRNRICAALDLTLPSTVLFDHPTPARLAGHLNSRLPDGAGTPPPATAPAPQAPPSAPTADGDAAGEPVAIVGMGCRLPGGVRSPEDLWQLLLDGTDAVSAFPTDRGWDLERLLGDPARPGGSAVAQGGFLYDAGDFDAEFFGISPREALAMDPQQRLLLETSWEALERAGIDPTALGGTRTGVFVGAMAQEYGPRLHEASDGVEGYALTGTTNSALSGRISYVLGLQGPALTVDTACSASLVALHLAVRSLRSGECSLALAGAATVMARPGIFVEFSRQRGLAPDGRCKAFSDDADGTGWAEGAGSLVLERLSDARRNGHRVLAVLSGTAVNQDGASNGLTAPNGPSQQQVIRQALADAGVRPGDVHAVEAHGTGTTLGDPIEAAALIDVYGDGRAPERPLWLGSLKSNIGHTQAAAGLAGVIKTVLALRHGLLPRTLHAEKPTGHVDWGGGAVRLLGAAVPWPETDGPRRAGVSAFGVSGTNAHVVVTEAPRDATEPEQTAPGAQPGRPLPYVLSARTPAALREQARRLRAALHRDESMSPAGVAHALATGRARLPHRAALVARDREGLDSALAALADDGEVAGLVRGVPAGDDRPVFVFPGQGGQWEGMATELLDSAPVFAARMAECEAVFGEFVDWSLTEVLRGAEGAPALDRVDVVQPALFAVMVSVAELWRSYGVEPSAVVGHSQGEIAAACVAGALSLRDAARVVCLRSRAILRLTGQGTMASVSQPAERVAELVRPWGDRISVAAHNGPGTVVVSGETDAVAGLLAECERREIHARGIPVDYASHSAHVETLRDELAGLLAPVNPRRADVPFYSTVTASVVDGTGLTGDYWYRNLRSTVRFEEVTRLLAADGHRVFVETGPHPTLGIAVQQTLDHADVADGATIGSLRRDDGGLDRFLAALGQAQCHGVEPDWSAVLAGHRPPPADLPTYPFERHRYWWTPPADLPAETAPQQQPTGVAAWRYDVAWRPVPEAGPQALSGTWLVVTDATGTDDEHAATAALRRAGADVVRCALPDRTPAPEALLAALDGRQPTGVLSLLALDVAAGPAAQVAAVAGLLRALDAAGVTAPLWCATRSAVATGPSDVAPRPAQAAVWGAGRAAALEHPREWGGLVDLPAAWDGRTGDRLAAVLAGGGDAEDQVAIRPAGVVARRLVRAVRGAADRTWRPRGTVLVTGGTGSLGLRLARWLAGRGAERVLLASRRGETAESAALAAELRDTGTELSAVTCDTTDREALAALLDDIGDEQPLTAVFHAAGAVELGPLRDTGPAELATVLGAKADGALLLDELLAGTPLDAFVLFSSISGTWGVADHGSYGAANACLDALAAGRRARGEAATSVAWGPWGGGGMIDESLFSGLAATGLPVLDPEPALQALQLALDHDETALAVADVDWDRFGPVFTTSRSSPLLRELVTAPEGAKAATDESATALRARLAGRTEDEQRETVLRLVVEHTAKVLGHRDATAIDTERAFKDAGFDSLTAVELRNRLAAATELRLPTTLVFDHPDPALLADHLWRQTCGGPATDPQPDDAGVRAVSDEPLAIVGMGCRLPGGVAGPDDLWRLLSEGREGVGTLPGDRGWDVEALYDPDPDRHGTSYTRNGGFLPRAGDFDHEFFGVSGREALAMDPQQRLLLETAWEAFEHAGLVPADLKGSETGVFAGALTPDYGQPHGMPGELEGYHVTGSAPSVASGRLAYTFGLTGPAVTVDTACSSSLVALHMAAQSLHSGECGLALVAGASVMSTPTPMVSFSRQRALSGDGRCRSFSDDADGFGMAEGVGVLLLERLSDAQRNGHRVLAVVRGSAVNQDGASNGLTAPNGPSQQRVIRHALRRAGLRPGDVDAVEAHGTGTPLGDPIEAQALLATYGRDRPEDRPLWLGSAKSNLGHTQAAAGVVGVIKMVLAMRHGTLPRTLHAEQPTSRVDWQSGGVRLLAESRAWPDTGRPCRAGVSAFGISGTNAHVVLEQAPELPQPETAAPEPVPEIVPWPLSARTPRALSEQAASLAAVAERGEDAAAVGRALATARARFEHRAVVVGRPSTPDFATGLAALAGGEPEHHVVSEVAGPLGRTVFVFPGQGAQWDGMAVELTEQSPVFAARMAECEAVFGEFVDWSLTEVLRGAEGAPALDRVDVVQPASFAVMVSLAELWRSYGVEPSAVVGHSQGEIAAACVAGALSLRDAARVVCLRSRLITAVAGSGGMATVALPADEVDDLIAPYDGRLSLAAVNGPRSAVLAGDRDALQAAVDSCKTRHVRAKTIPVDYASHSAHVEPILAELAEVLAPVRPHTPDVPFFSTVTGDWITEAAFDAAYWCTNLRQPVRFGAAIRELTEQGYGLFVENSPHPVLLTALEEAVEDRDDAYAVGSLHRDQGGLRRFLLSLGQAWTRGADVDWTPAVPVGGAARHVELPTYPFQRRRHWIEPPAAAAARRDRAVADSWRYGLDWTEVPETGARELTGDWLVVTPREPDPDVDAVLRGLTGHGATVHRLTADELPDAAPKLPAHLTGVLSLAALDEHPRADEPAVTTGLADTVAVVRALAAMFPDTPLWTATRGAVGATDADRVDHPVQAQIWGLGTVLGLDEPHRWCGRIDLPPALDERAVERLAEALTGLGGENELAVRDSGSYARRLVPAPAGDADPWRPRDTVLITGGTGALGAHVARWAAGNGARHLVLTSRRGRDAPGAEELHAELTGLGAEVTIAACDVADRDALAAVLAGIPDGRPLRAVVHAAGLTQSAIPAAELTVAELARTCRVKVDGARNLDALTAGLDLDAFVLFSSGAATWGDAGKGGYAAANAHLDALAQQRRARGAVATSVAWGAWGGGGMVEGEVADLLTQRGMRLMKPETAVRALATAVGNGDTRVAIASFDLARFLPLYTMSRDRRLVAELSAAQPDTSGSPQDRPDGEQPDGALAQRLAGLTEQEQEDALIDVIRREIAAVLKAERPEEIKARRAFKELGFDSLTALEFRNRLNVATGMRLPATVVFDHPSPSALARHLRRELAGGGAGSVPADLDRLEASLAALPREEWAELDVVDRLRALLRRAEADADHTGDDAAATPDDDLAAASNDEIFELIDRELGI